MGNGDVTGAEGAGGMAGNEGVMDAGFDAGMESGETSDIGAAEEETMDLEIDSFLDSLGTLPNEELKHLIEGLMQFFEGRQG